MSDLLKLGILEDYYKELLQMTITKSQHTICVQVHVRWRQIPDMQKKMQKRVVAVIG